MIYSQLPHIGFSGNSPPSTKLTPPSEGQVPLGAHDGNSAQFSYPQAIPEQHTLQSYSPGNVFVYKSPEAHSEHNYVQYGQQQPVQQPVQQAIQQPVQQQPVQQQPVQQQPVQQQHMQQQHVQQPVQQSIPQVPHAQTQGNASSGVYSVPYQIPFPPIYLAPQPIPIPNSNQSSVHGVGYTEPQVAQMSVPSNVPPSMPSSMPSSGTLMNYNGTYSGSYNGGSYHPGYMGHYSGSPTLPGGFGTTTNVASPMSGSTSTKPRTRSSSGMKIPLSHNSSHSNSRPDGVPLGRRTKVSWACDKCRLRKTRCDMDESTSTCTPCARAGVPCTFLRTQLRRGPSRKRSGMTSGSSNSPLPQNSHLSRVRSRSDPAHNDLRRSGAKPISGPLSPAIEEGSPDNRSEKISTESPSRQPPQLQSPSQQSQVGLPALVAAAYRRSPSPSASELSAHHDLNKPHTPPGQNEEIIKGISHGVLTAYFKHIHPLFPLLPDQISDINTLIDSAGPARENLITALTAIAAKTSKESDSAKTPQVAPLSPSLVTKSSPVESISIALGTLSTAEALNSSAVQEAHLIALLLTYLHTLDAAWIGGAVAAATTLLSRQSDERACQLVALLVVFDKLHCNVHGSLSLVPDSLLRYAESSERIRPLLNLFSYSSQADFAAVPQELKELGMFSSSTTPNVQETRSALASYVAQIQQATL